MADVPAPAAKAAGSLKRVPKWAWIAGAGVTGGVIFYRFTHKSAPDTAPATDQTSPADYAQTYSPLGTVTATPVSNGGFDSGIPQQSAGGYSLEDVTTLLAGLQAAQPAPAPQPSLTDLLNSVLPYVGGGAPQSGTTQQQPAAAQQPAPPPPAASGPPPCPSKYPFRSDRGCYQVYCAPKGGSRAPGRWHNYQSGADQFIHGLPC